MTWSHTVRRLPYARKIEDFIFARILRDSIEYARELRRRAANEPDLDLRAQMEKAKVELFTDYPRPTKGKFKEYVDEGILEWKPIPSQ